MRSALAIVMLSSLAFLPSPSDATKTGTLPDGWKVRFDDPAARPTQVNVQEKENAFTFTTGPAAIYYKPAMKAAGDYELSAVVSQIKTVAHPEGYGLFIAGSDLDRAGMRCTYFVVRQDGRFLIAARHGGLVIPIVDWTPAPPMHEPSGMKTSNTLVVRATGDEVLFLIDGTPVRRLTRTEAGGDGIAGVRVGADLHVQATKLTLKKR